jgi:type II secretory pathway component PulF
MLQRAGRMERDQALRRLKATSQWLGPALIVVLGAVIGLVFASLLTGITQLGAIGGVS